MAELEQPAAPRKSAAGTVAAGILSSRIAGFLREKAVMYFFGVSAYSDIFQAAFKGPNLLQNLLGEGTISAAFIPIYSRMIEEGREKDAGRFAGAVFGLLLAMASTVVLLGILLAGPIVAVFVPGWLDDAARVAAGTLPINRYAISVQAVRIIFPMTGILVLSAWALGVLNSHRKFFLPYFAPVLWNVAIIAGLVGTAYAVLGDPFGFDALEDIPSQSLVRLLFAAFLGALAGGLLQFLVQLPLVFRLLRGFRISLSMRVAGVRDAVRAFGPVVAGRGVYQLSNYLDIVLASWLATGALASLRPAQMLYILPVSLFGLSVAASELPELSRFRAEERQAFLQRVNTSMLQALFLTIPTMVGYLAFGYLIIGMIFRGGAFGQIDNFLVYFVLAGYSLGLLATTISRLLQNTFYALHDTKTPARIAVARVAVSAAVAIPLMLWLNQFAVDETLGFEATRTLSFGAVGLSVAASTGAFVELWRLRRALRIRIESFELPWSRIMQLMGMAALAAAPAAVIWWLVAGASIVLVGLMVVPAYGLLYLGIARLTAAPELKAWMSRM
jgi:putative peptidoglycan lipid II flippase